MTPTLTPQQLSVARLVAAWATRSGFPPRLLIAVAAGESSLDPSAVGDDGTSFGVFQIHIPAHGGAASLWTGLDGIERSADQMRDRWRRTYDELGGAAAFERQGASFLQRFWKDGQGTRDYPSIPRCTEVLAVADEALRLIGATLSPAEPAPPAPAPPHAGSPILRAIGRALVAAGRVLEES